MRRPSHPLRHPIVAAAMVSCVAYGCAPGGDEPPAPAAAVEPKLIPTPAVPPPLTRPELIRAAASAASATAVGAAYPRDVADLAGRDFRLLMPVGCAGPTDTGSIRYSHDADKQTLKLTAQPQIWSEAAWAQALADRDRIEAIEGFWIRRPWLLSDACPMPGADQTSASSSSETLGVAQAFAEGGSRVLRRGRRPYEATVRLDPGVAPTPGAWRLVLKGRLGGGAGGPIRCRLESPERPPVCLILVEFDQVAFEAADGAVAAEWTG